MFCTISVRLKAHVCNTKQPLSKQRTQLFMSCIIRSNTGHTILATAVVLSCDCVCHIPWLGQVRGHTKSSGRHIHDLLFSMKKQDAPQLRHLKYRDRIGGKFPVPSTIEVQVVGSGGKGVPKAVMLATDHSKYLFNCGEGTQRISTEFKLKISKMENIFITHMNWENIGGLLGMGLTLEGMKLPKIIIHGPPGVENVAMMAKGFAESTSMVVEKKALADGHFEDSAFKIDYVPFCKKGFEPEKFRELLEEKEAKEPDRKRHKKPLVENAVAVSYVCWPRSTQRKIILEKCVDLGIERGPVLGKLKNGESITLDNGTVVHPDQVLSDPEIAHPILIVDCPTEEYMDTFLSNEKLASHQGCAGNNPQKPALVVHMTPLQVFQTQEYQQWMERFGCDTEHLVLNELTSEVAFEGVYRYQSRLHLVHNTIFPQLKHLPPERWPGATTEYGFRKENGDQLLKGEKVVAGCANLRYLYRPPKGFSRDQCVQLDHKTYVTEVLEQQDAEKVLRDLHQDISSQERTEDSDSTQENGAYPRLTFLGTGSSIPSKGRNVSGLVVHLREDATMILDCGEGTSGQLYRHYGDQAADVLQNLKAVFVSHLHADHHMGLFSLLRDRKAALEAAGKEVTPALLLAPFQIARWLQFYHNQVEPIQGLFRHIPLQKLLPHMLELPENEEMYQEVLQKVSLTKILPVEVEHCPNAFGVALTHSDGWKLVFSGDTMPCQRLVVAGTDCDILVHEATHEDDLEEEAKMKRHSTTSQAVDIGQQMKAKFILLNHFSQRYAKIPIFSKAVPDNVGISFDNMTVSMQELPLLPRFIPALKTLFADEHADLEAKTLKRNKRKEMQGRSQATS
ncbi:zinc phosphodiesterase ELAC protein 2-like [Littorina saxatilis]|uniref:zinc phosphodiesterase ELAC protein 2-like n=1 Tax=Littorina saxatilis TaxID=31220 RepID=UPI0038B5DAD9